LSFGRSVELHDRCSQSGRRLGFADCCVAGFAGSRFADSGLAAGLDSSANKLDEIAIAKTSEQWMLRVILSPSIQAEESWICCSRRQA
jgi:hypothetical protein